MGRNRMIMLSAAVAMLVATGCTGPAGSPGATLEPTDREAKAVVTLTSPAFPEGADIPLRFATRAGGGNNTSIPYVWSGTPAETKSLALLLVDRAPAARGWVHWLVTDIPAHVTSLPEGASGSSAMPAGASELASTFGSRGYGGPQPPPGSGRHPYTATLYALDVTGVDLPPDASLGDFERAIAGHVLGEGSCTGYLGR